MKKNASRGEEPRRAWAAAAFATVALVLAGTWFLPTALRTKDAATLVLYVCLPGLGSALAGWLVGPSMSPRATGALGAAARGAATGLLGFTLYAPLFALGIKWLEPDWSSVRGLTALTFWLGLVAVGWVIAGAGALTGWAVWRFGPD